ncbi:hypothetical protein CN97_00655 [Haematobacter massiliensis]|uniref:Uncharacterized protein n=1 Tax=Haematobacter massiliensis TaxID=195105 RepID=A0A086Y0H5_9RHOB|nr:hypothetical protein [Haematobacter massiliensis]KFI27775.1 hypothetical protein CN97_00655 [Haematobacter massiliensis]
MALAKSTRTPAGMVDIEEMTRTIHSFGPASLAEMIARLEAEPSFHSEGAMLFLDHLRRRCNRMVSEGIA